MALKFKKKGPAQAEATVSNSQKGKQISEETATEKVNVPAEVASDKPSDEPWCEVGFEASYTMNLGNYESTRINVSIKVPCLTEEIDAVFEYGQNWVNGKLEHLIGEIKGEASE